MKSEFVVYPNACTYGKYKCENMICILSGSIKEINGILLYASI